MYDSHAKQIIQVPCTPVPWFIFTNVRKVDAYTCNTYHTYLYTCILYIMYTQIY